MTGTGNRSVKTKFMLPRALNIGYSSRERLSLLTKRLCRSYAIITAQFLGLESERERERERGTFEPIQCVGAAAYSP